MQTITYCNIINCEDGAIHIHCSYPDCNKIIYKHVIECCYDDGEHDCDQENTPYYDYHSHCNFVKPNGEKCKQTDFHSHCIFPNCTDRNPLHRHCMEKLDDVYCELKTEHIHCDKCNYIGVAYKHIHFLQCL